MKLLITGAWNCTPEQLNAIKIMGHDVLFMQNESEGLPECAECAEGIICNGLFLHHDVKEFKNLKYIQLTSAGFDRVPMDYVKERNIKIYNARGVYSIPMAEYAVFGVLQLYKKARYFYENQRKKIWKKNTDALELFGKTVLVIGCGSIGTECAKRFSAFGCRVIGVDLFPAQKYEYYDKIYPISDMDNVLRTSDVVVLTLPLTNETRHMMNGERFAIMKKNAVLVNIARGALIDEEALIRALDSGLMGAVLDVFLDEPLLTESPLWEKENVIITPHNSFVGEGNAERLWRVIYGNLESHL